MIIIPFLYSVDNTQRDYNLAEKMLEEKDGIISMCLHAFHGVLCNNCIFSECLVADEMKKQWRKQGNELDYTIEGFLNECVQVTGKQSDEIFASDFYEAYKAYCAKRGWDALT